jgi:hypothetical protein
MREDRGVADQPLSEPTVTCHWCGVSASPTPVTWSVATSERGLEYLCESCTRTNARNIEGSLPSEYW